MKKKSLRASLIIGLTMLIVALHVSVCFGYWGTLSSVGEPVGWVETLLAMLEPLLGAEAAALIAAFLYSFLGRWANHEPWNWQKFEPTLKVALVNGILFTLLNILTGWSFTRVEIWVMQIASLYVMQKFWLAIGEYFAPLFKKKVG